MTNESSYSVGTAIAISCLKDHIDFLKDFKPPYGLNQVSPSDVIKHRKHRLLVGMSLRVLSSAITNGATEEEIEKLVKIMLIFVDARKHLLDVDQAIELYDFGTLMAKYF